jgi:hypothetical protein
VLIATPDPLSDTEINNERVSPDRSSPRPPSS